MLTELLLMSCILTCMPAMAYMVGDIYNILKRDFGHEHWFTEKKKGDLL